MYEEMVEELRRPHADCDPFALMDKAADAIEELSMKLHGDEAAIAGMKRQIERMVVTGKADPIPPHGRLIDADALCEYCNNVTDHSATPNDIMRFPTIIPAEEGE